VPLQTIPEIFLSAVRERPRADCFSYRTGENRWEPVSSETAFHRVLHLRHGLRSIGVEPGDRVALLAENRLEWALSDLAILAQAAITVPVYPTLLPEGIAGILRDCEPKVVLASTAEQAEKLHQIRDRLPFLRDVVTFETTDIPRTLTFAKLEEIGRKIVEDQRPELRNAFAPIRGDDLASIIYTSGTTGDPKGVMLTHTNFVSNVLGAMERFEFRPADSALSFLPLSHVFERTAGYYAMLHAGVGIAYAESLETVPRDLQEVRPTILVSVPRLYEKIYGRVLAQVNAGTALRKRIFFWARDVGRRHVQRTIAGASTGRWLDLQRAVADRLVFTKLRARTGGRIRLFVSGGAPLAPKICEFFHAAGLPIMEGYGLTETSPVISCNYPGHIRFGSVGQAFPETEIRIADDGEIQVRGPQVMRGYYRNEAATHEIVDPEGWLATGDIGHVDGDGYLFITDRKKDLIVTAGGKNVAPQPIEEAFKQNRYVAQAVVVGNRRPYLSVLLVPDFDQLKAYAQTRNLEGGSLEQLLKRPEIVELFAGVLERVNADLPRFSQIKTFALLAREFRLEAGELTPTLKVRRFEIDRRYREVIERLYPDQPGDGD
jgi:long-chain acyl-CoA synthetase